jgi:hypothetical protein
MIDFRAADFAILNPTESRWADADNAFQIPERQTLRVGEDEAMILP